MRAGIFSYSATFNSSASAFSQASLQRYTKVWRLRKVLNIFIQIFADIGVALISYLV